jgi:hypothetical protein
VPAGDASIPGRPGHAGFGLAPPGPGGYAAIMPGRMLGIAALVTWLVDAGSGGYMLATWLARGGLYQQRAAGDRLAPRVVFGHFGLASTGLLVWTAYLLTSLVALAWLAVGLLMLVIGLGISTVTVWTPFPARRHDALAGPADGGAALGIFTAPAEDAVTGALTDEVLTRALTDDALLRRLVDDVVAQVPADPARAARRPRSYLATLIPAGHGMAAIATFLLAVLTAVSAR